MTLPLPAILILTLGGILIIIAIVFAWLSRHVCRATNLVMDDYNLDEMSVADKQELLLKLEVASGHLEVNGAVIRCRKRINELRALLGPDLLPINANAIIFNFTSASILLNDQKYPCQGFMKLVKGPVVVTRLSNGVLARSMPDAYWVPNIVRDVLDALPMKPIAGDIFVLDPLFGAIVQRHLRSGGSTAHFFGIGGIRVMSMGHEQGLIEYC